jgi:predicted O-methyltransferase YrrM
MTLRTILWYLKRPRLYPELFRLAKSAARPQPAALDTQKEAERWCGERAIDTPEAIANLTEMSMPESVRTKFRDALVEARLAATRCPVKMGGAADLDLLYWLAEHLQAKRVIETGVGYGWSSLILLLSLAKRDGAMLISTDRPYPNRNNDAYVGCIVPAELRSRWRIVNYADHEALPRALQQLPTIDLCHYDSGKSCAARMWAYPRLWQALRPGGCFVSDDVGDNLAFHDFCRQVNAESIIVRTAFDFSSTLVPGAARSFFNVGTKYAGILVKNVSAGLA